MLTSDSDMVAGVYVRNNCIPTRPSQLFLLDMVSPITHPEAPSTAPAQSTHGNTHTQ